MVIARTPFRISFFGGGTDYPVWFRENGGAVLSTTIDKYCYVSGRFLPPFFEHKSRIVWSQIELVQTPHEIRHPAVREILKYLEVKEGVEIHHQGDLPARSGLGSSSSFTVGLLQVVKALKGQIISKEDLANEAIHLEQNILKESVGSQDQVAAAFGGFNKIEFDRRDHFTVSPVVMDSARLRQFEDHLLLIYTGMVRTAHEVASVQIKETPKKGKELKAMGQMVDEALKILSSKNDMARFGRLLHEAWRLKRSLTGKISNGFIDEIYGAGLRAGAVGGKILGAGGGGFLLFFVEPGRRKKVKDKLSGLLEVPFSFENVGSQIVFYQPDRPFR